VSAAVAVEGAHRLSVEELAAVRAEMTPYEPPKLSRRANPGDRLFGRDVQAWLRAGVDVGLLAPGDVDVYAGLCSALHGSPRGTFDYGTRGLASTLGMRRSRVSRALLRLEAFRAVWMVRDPVPAWGPFRSASIIGVAPTVIQVAEGKPPPMLLGQTTTSARVVDRQGRPLGACPVGAPGCRKTVGYRIDGRLYDSCGECRRQLRRYRFRRKPWTSLGKAVRRAAGRHEPKPDIPTNDEKRYARKPDIPTNDEKRYAPVTDEDRRAGREALRTMREQRARSPD